MSNRDTFGWDLMAKTVEDDVKNKEDVLMVVIHWMLIKRGFGCFGLGPEPGTSASAFSSTDICRETLPSGWSANETSCLRYLYKDQVYLLHRMRSENNFIFNLVNTANLDTSNVVLSLDCVTNLKGKLDEIVTDHKEVMHKIKVQLIEPVTQKATKEIETQTDRSRSPDPRSSSDPSTLRDITFPERRVDPLRVDPRGVGRSDLDPFGVGGGMLFDPFRGGHGPPINPGFGAIGGLPRGSIPPGARFDPMGPVVPGGMNPRRPPPDADHLPPPGYDDMFM